MRATSPTRVWAGVDVGGRRKGFHVAVVDGRRLRAGPERRPDPRGVVDFLVRWAPRVVAIDSPRATADDGESVRACERDFARAHICGIRWTPDRGRLADNPYYEWIVHGLELYAALGAAGLETIECFPTASWTRWGGPRGRTRREVWSRRALSRLGLGGLPPDLDQDERDAIGAALTAREHDAGRSERFGDIIVPARQPRRRQRA